MLIPKNRHEYYLAVISDNDYPTFPPKIREEQYLAKLAGREVDVPSPKTPKERAYYNIINDIKFEPENRWQTLVAAANDDSITAPIPRTREEIWWANISLSHEVIVEYVDTLPATLQTVAGYLESYKIYGNTAQSGTPTPENPIMPSGCGVRTGNLFDVVQYRANYIHGKARDDSGTEFTAEYNGYSTYMVPVVAGETYVLKGTTSKKIDTTNWLSRIYFLNSQKQFVSRSNSFTNFTTDSVYTFTIPDGITYIELQMCTELTYDDVMLVKGSAPLPYEPYGYKLPILSNSTVTNIYLGEVQTTRRIKKYVFTGEENGTLYSTSTSRKGIDITGIPGIIGGNADIAILAICTHYQPNTRSVLYRNTDNGISNAFRNDNIIFYDANYQTVEAFQQFCAQQYAAGTPVTVWYVLTEPETGIVNEPLMKIGDYADTIDSTQTDVQIPTAAGTTVIDYNGEPKPDKVELTYKTIKRNYISADDKVYQDLNGQLLGG